MVGLYQLTLKVAVEMSMLGNELSVPALFIRVSNLRARIPSRYNTLGWWLTVSLELCFRPWHERFRVWLTELDKIFDAYYYESCVLCIM